jgi:uncharacterized membrane protein
MSYAGQSSTSTLVVITYPDEHRAAEVMATLQRLREEYLIDLDDAVYVTKGLDGKLKLHQTTNLAGGGAAWGGMWGMLIGLLFFAPIAGLAIGAATGAIAGNLADYGIDDKFAKQLSSTLTPGSSAIFVLVRRSTPDRVIPEIAKFGGTVMRTSLPKDTEAKLQEALNRGAGEQLAQQQVAIESQMTPPPPTPQASPTSTVQ